MNRHELLKLFTIRKSVRKFDPMKEISLEEIDLIKNACLRAPSSFNSQPFRCVLVREPEIKKDLAHTMIGLDNARRILQAPLTAVFLADKQSVLNKDKMFELSENQRTPLTYQQKKRNEDNMAYVSGFNGALIQTAAGFASEFLAPTQVPEDETVWAVKQTIFFVDHYLLACAALGVSTSPMEGFDEQRVRHVVGASDRYYCPVVVPTGYEQITKESDENNESEIHLSARLDSFDIFTDNKLL
jgi:nitroreductase